MPIPNGPTPMPKLLIVTVNYRTAALTIKCLASIAADLRNLPEQTRMVVVDNQSGDGSVDTIRNAIEENGWQSWAEVVAAERNGGFSYGNNIAIRPALAADQPPDYFWLLNPDAESLEGAGKALLDFMEAHPKAGLATSRYIDPEGEQKAMAFRHFTALSEFFSNLRLGIIDRLLPKTVIPVTPELQPHQAEWLSGTSLMIRREVFDTIGLMDEGYFLYFEESDFCLQAQRKGWELWYVPESRILHVIGASTGFRHTSARQPRRPGYWFESRRRYFIKNHGAAYAALADALHMAGYSLWLIRQFIQRKQNLDPPAYLTDFFRHSVFVKGFSLDRRKG